MLSLNNFNVVFKQNSMCSNFNVVFNVLSKVNSMCSNLASNIHGKIFGFNFGTCGWIYGYVFLTPNKCRLC